MEVATQRLEIASAVLRPHFDAVRDVFVGFRPEPGHAGLLLLRKTRLIIDPAVHDTFRHFAMCSDDGMVMRFAPEAVDLPIETVVAITAHEFGHASDFAYPARWVLLGRGKAEWIPADGSKPVKRWQRAWRERNQAARAGDEGARDQIEWAADGISQAVTGKKTGYCGSCLLQCFAGGIERPVGLR
jgi:hypothetical protein